MSKIGLALAWSAMAALCADGQAESHLLLDYDSETGDFTYINDALGTGRFYSNGFLGQNTIVANVEGGHIWFDHQALNRPPDATSTFFTFETPGALNQVDYHATMVGHVLSGSGYVSNSNPAQFYYVGIGMVPYASVWSGSIATEFSPSALGSFDITPASTLTTYKAFFNGIGNQQPDVINSSWGRADPAGTLEETVAIDGLARQNPTVTFVVSAGNDGPGQVAGPGSGYNSITVGSIGGAGLLDPSGFSSRGAADFYNPVTGVSIPGVRTAVDVAAPGETLVLAAYLGASGSLAASSDPQIEGILQDPPAEDLYFKSMDGTSFSAPIVAGGVALLKDVAKSFAYSVDLGEAALDSRVVKSVLMASSRETNGWNNGQTRGATGAIVTTQSLDYATGAGSLDMENAAAVFVAGTTDVTGTSGGMLLGKGWDFGTLARGSRTEYFFLNPFEQPVELTVSLNWFVGRAFDNGTDIGTDLSFADLNLEIWKYLDGAPSVLVAESVSLYNNTEFLRVTIDEVGIFGLAVDFQNWVYQSAALEMPESYGMAWQATAIPEPSHLVFFGMGLLVWRLSRRSNAQKEKGSAMGQQLTIDRWRKVVGVVFEGEKM